MSGQLIVIFGAAVWPDGRASPTLARRIGYGLLAAQTWPQALVLCAGAAGGEGEPSEASVMAKALAARGVARARLLLDEASRDTFQSVIVTARLARGRAIDSCIVCSDRYHIPRIRLLLAALGIASTGGPTAPGRAGTPLRYWLKMRLREAVAIPYDLAVVLVRGRRLLARLERGG
ncbi:MAG: hypothetical protein JWP49_1893 [Phenylobacterium sp.]|nr:hypothetical protein [Phenylobacterium sp.]